MQMLNQNVTTLNTSNYTITDISAELASAWVTSGEAILLDIREQEELEMEWIPGATPMSFSKFDISAVAKMESKKIIVICLTGRRSKIAARQLWEHGISEVYNVKDGLLAWTAAGLETIDQSALMI
jgi:rhodanese-related sulfurtransferase